MSTEKQCDYCKQSGVVLFDPRQRAYKGPVHNFVSCRKCWALKDTVYFKRIDAVERREHEK